MRMVHQKNLNEHWANEQTLYNIFLLPLIPLESFELKSRNHVRCACVCVRVHTHANAITIIIVRVRLFRFVSCDGRLVGIFGIRAVAAAPFYILSYNRLPLNTFNQKQTNRKKRKNVDVSSSHFSLLVFIFIHFHIHFHSFDSPSIFFYHFLY